MPSYIHALPIFYIHKMAAQPPVSHEYQHMAPVRPGTGTVKSAASVVSAEPLPLLSFRPKRRFGNVLKGHHSVILFSSLGFGSYIAQMDGLMSAIL